MPLTVEQIVEMVASRPGGGRRGALMWHLREMSRAVQRGAAVNGAQRRLIQALMEQPEADAAQGYAHPERAARAHPRPPGAEPFALAAVDVAWLQRLPAGEQATYRDAVALAELAKQVVPGSADERLVESIWAPVKARHDRAAALADLETARRPLPPVPRDLAVAALAEAIAAETSELTDREGRSRADLLYDEATAARSAQHGAAVDEAAARLDDLTAQQSERDRLTA